MSEGAEKRALLKAQEKKLLYKLVDSNKTIRERALKNLKQWFEKRSLHAEFTEEDLLVIWKGLFYCMWMSDKFLPQEECAEKISNLVHMPTVEASLMFFKCGLTTLAQEWYGLDQFRVGKFTMFVRRFLRQALFVLKRNKWSSKLLDDFCEVISSTVLKDPVKSNSLGLWMHFVEIYLEEVAKVSEGKIRPDCVLTLITPFIECVATARDGRLLSHVHKFIFVHLIKQSDLGLEYVEKYEAWKQEGFPGSIDSMKKVKLPKEKNNDDVAVDEEKPLDPRAGRVDVDLPQLKFPAKSIAETLAAVKSLHGGTARNRKTLSNLIELFQKLSSGVYPLGTRRLHLPKDDGRDMSVRKAVIRLVKFDRKIMGTDSKNRRNKKRRSSQVDVDEEEPTNKKSKVERDGVAKKMNGSVLDEELQNFIRKSEGHLRCDGADGNGIGVGKKRNGVRKSVIVEPGSRLKIKPKKAKVALKKELDDVEFIFKRNSGTWYVTPTANSPSPKTSSGSELGAVINKNLDELSGTSEIGNGFIASSKTKDQKLAESPKSPKKSSIQSSVISSPTRSGSSPSASTPQIGSPKSNLLPVKLFESPPEEKKEKFYPDPWSEPLQEGEYEICLSRKKKSQLLQKHNSTFPAKNKIRGKKRLSLDPALLEDPFGLKSTKKVKINTKLNRSQEIHEHLSQILSSPAIPYDANRKPTKPLLKATLPSPLDPFYKQLEEF